MKINLYPRKGEFVHPYMKKAGKPAPTREQRYEHKTKSLTIMFLFRK